MSSPPDPPDPPAPPERRPSPEDARTAEAAETGGEIAPPGEDAASTDAPRPPAVEPREGGPVDAPATPDRAEPVPELTVEPAPGPDAELAPGPVAEPAAEPVAKPAPEPVAKPAAEPAPSAREAPSSLAEGAGDSLPAEAPALAAAPSSPNGTEKEAIEAAPPPIPADATAVDGMAEPPPPLAPPVVARPPAPTPEPAPQAVSGSEEHGYLATLTLAALGVVYGDIGTSPLYALRECFHGPHAIAASPANLMGVLSLIFYSLVLVISIKYLAFILRADNRGEGGILSLMALALRPKEIGPRERLAIFVMGIFGAALFYGDGMITPAISVLSAVEGLSVAAPPLSPYILPTTIAILVGLFTIQSRGTARIGKVFGPITLVWFLVLAALGIPQIVAHPQILGAIDPSHAVRFFAENRGHGFLVLGAIFLVVTGGEALYADMGHFGRTPIRLAWFGLVLPALLLNYFGQGALLLATPGAVENPFYLMAPSWGRLALVALATAATCIASQAVISGAFSLTRQAIQLGYCPRLQIVQTSETEIGQIYIPWINWMLLITIIALVIGFESSSNLAAAYGIAVTMTMVITTILAYNVMRRVWRWRPWVTVLILAPFLVIEVAFFLANALKILHGGWFPLAAGAIVFTLLTTWRKGREILAERLKPGSLPMDLFLESLAQSPPVRVRGTAVYMVGTTDGVSHALLHNLKHNKVLHERVVFLTVLTEDIPTVPLPDRLSVERIDATFLRMVARYGFMETPDVPALLRSAGRLGLEFNLMDTTFFLGRETLLATRRRPGMALWRESLFVWMSRNSRAASDFFRLPPNRVVELGAQIEL